MKSNSLLCALLWNVGNFKQIGWYKVLHKSLPWYPVYCLCVWLPFLGSLRSWSSHLHPHARFCWEPGALSGQWRFIFSCKTQGSKGIRQWTINCCTSRMMLHTITPFAIKISSWNVWTFNLINQLIKIQLKVPKVVKPSNKKVYFKTLGTSVIKSPVSPPSLCKTTLWRVIHLHVSGKFQTIEKKWKTKPCSTWTSF